MKTVDIIRRGIQIRLIDMNSSIRRTAMSAGIARQTITTFLSGNTDIRLATLATYCDKGLDMTLDEIIKLGK